MRQEPSKLWHFNVNSLQNEMTKIHVLNWAHKDFWFENPDLSAHARPLQWESLWECNLCATDNWTPCQLVRYDHTTWLMLAYEVWKYKHGVKVIASMHSLVFNTLYLHCQPQKVLPKPKLLQANQHLAITKNSSSQPYMWQRMCFKICHYSERHSKCT